jgi:hypothetical protein
VIEKDHPQSDTAEEIEPKITFDRAEESSRLAVEHVSLHFLPAHYCAASLFEHVASNGSATGWPGNAITISR